jgi:hypothetical protein
VEGELLPKFVQLLLQGPPAPGLLSHADVAAGSAAYQQQQLQRLAEWRMLRQARLLSVQEQLAELPHVLETLRWAAAAVCSAHFLAQGVYVRNMCVQHQGLEGSTTQHIVLPDTLMHVRVTRSCLFFR